MTPLRNRRYDKAHEQLLFSPLFSVLVGWVITVALPAAVYWGHNVFWQPNDGQFWGLVTATAALVVSRLGVMHTLSAYPGGRSMGLIFPHILIVYVVAALLPLLFRIEVSRYLLAISAILAVVWFQIEFILTERFRRPKLAVISQGLAADLLTLPEIDARELTKPDLEGKRYDAVVADFECLTPEWERFLARCALNRIAVHNARSVYESVTGRVRINRMSENDIGSLLPSQSLV